VPGVLAAPAVGSYPTVSPLPAPSHPVPLPQGERGNGKGRWRSILCGTFQGSPPLGLPRAACPVESGPSSGSPPRPPGRLPYPRGPRVTAPRAHPDYTPERGAATEGPEAPGTEKGADDKNEPGHAGEPGKRVRPPPRTSRRRDRDTLGGEESEQPVAQVDHGLGRLGPVRLDSGLGQDFLPFGLGNDSGRPLPKPGLNPPAAILAPQEHDKQGVRGETPRGEHSARVRGQVRERVVPGRKVHERHPTPLQGPDCVPQPLAVRPVQGLAVVVDRADLLWEGPGRG